MNREKTYYTCPNCDTRNNIHNIACQACGWVQEKPDHATNTNVDSEAPSLGVPQTKVDSVEIPLVNTSWDQPTDTNSHSEEPSLSGLAANADLAEIPTPLMKPSRPEREGRLKSSRKPAAPGIFSLLGSAFQKGSRRIKRRMILLSILIVIVILLSTVVSYVIKLNVPSTIGLNGIGVTSVDGEDIGVSDGSYALDTNRAAGPLMIQASESLRNGNLGPAMAEWNDAYNKDTSDAEPLIYMEDQRVLASGSPYITVVLGVLLGVKVNDGLSRDVFQAAYLVQKECNANPQLSGGKKLRLLLARSGSNPNQSENIANQVVQAARFDKTIVGVQGWENSLATLNVVKIFASAHLPLVGADTASDALTGLSRYFFRVGPPSSQFISLATPYIEKEIAPQRMVVFRDHTEPFSSGLADDFTQAFTKDGYHIASTEDFKTADETQLARDVQSVLATYKPDFILLATNTVGDVTTVLNNIPSTQEYANLKVFAGAAGYALVQSGQPITGYTHMLIAASAFPDEWSILAPGNQEPPFFNDYPATYDPYDQHTKFPYTYRRADGEVMMDYDALYVFLVGCRIAIQQKHIQNPTPEDIRNALSQINSAQPYQGITGAISFGSNGNPINKLHFLLHVVDGQYLHVAAYQGCLPVSSECDNSINILE